MYASWCDGLTSSPYRECMVVYGGAHHDMVWYLDLLLLQWHEERCGGDIPPATLYHAAAVGGSILYVCGGEHLDADGEDAPVRGPHGGGGRRLEVYALDLATLEWTHLRCDDAPADRMHHTASVTAANQLIVVGGKSFQAKATAADLDEMHRSGFFDVHVCDLTSRVWRHIITARAAISPLWGHTATVLAGGGAVLLCGGFEVTSEEDPALGCLVPTLGINKQLYLIHTDTFSCDVIADPMTTTFGSRALHAAHYNPASGDVIIYGGVAIDEAYLSLQPRWDCVKFSPHSREWVVMPFFAARWRSCKLLSMCYSDSFVVADVLDVVNVRHPSGVWERMPCDHASLTTSPLSQGNGPHKTRPLLGRFELTAPLEGRSPISREGTQRHSPGGEFESRAGDGDCDGEAAATWRLWHSPSPDRLPEPHGDLIRYHPVISPVVRELANGLGFPMS